MSNKCPICWEERSEVVGNKDGGNIAQTDCAICGRFEIGKMAAFKLSHGAGPVAKLSGWIRAQNLREIAPRITQENLDEVVRDLPDFLVSDRSVELLKALAILKPIPGDAHKGDVRTDYPLAWARGPDELKFHLFALGERGLVKYSTVGEAYSATLLPAGWHEVQRGGAAVLDRAFVAMSFSPDMAQVWQSGFKPGITSAGYLPHRVDSAPHIERIDQKIIADIRASLFVVADVTQQKNGVYFEAGYALGANKPVFWTVREDELDKVHFDTRQFAHVVWKEPADLAEQLRNLIVGVLGQGSRPTTS